MCSVNNDYTSMMEDYEDVPFCRKRKLRGSKSDGWTHSRKNVIKGGSVLRRTTEGLSSEIGGDVYIQPLIEQRVKIHAFNEGTKIEGDSMDFNVFEGNTAHQPCNFINACVEQNDNIREGRCTRSWDVASQTNTMLGSRDIASQTNAMLGSQDIASQTNTTLDSRDIASQTNTMLGSQDTASQTNTVLGSRDVASQTNTMLGSRDVASQTNTMLNSREVACQSNTMLGSREVACQSNTMQDSLEVATQTDMIPAIADNTNLFIQMRELIDIIEEQHRTIIRNSRYLDVNDTTTRKDREAEEVNISDSVQSNNILDCVKEFSIQVEDIGLLYKCRSNDNENEFVKKVKEKDEKSDLIQVRNIIPEERPSVTAEVRKVNMEDANETPVTRKGGGDEGGLVQDTNMIIIEDDDEEEEDDNNSDDDDDDDDDYDDSDDSDDSDDEDDDDSDEEQEEDDKDYHEEEVKQTEKGKPIAPYETHKNGSSAKLSRRFPEKERKGPNEDEHFENFLQKEKNTNNNRYSCRRQGTETREKCDGEKKQHLGIYDLYRKGEMKVKRWKQNAKKKKMRSRRTSYLYN